jgi:DNA-binding transcriptional LysR family regulator
VNDDASIGNPLIELCFFSARFQRRKFVHLTTFPQHARRIANAPDENTHPVNFLRNPMMKGKTMTLQAIGKVFSTPHKELLSERERYLKLSNLSIQNEGISTMDILDGSEMELPPNIRAQTVDNELSRIDLNLLVALEGLLVCRNVTHAARRLGQTQPSMSRALARLREILGDDLLVRSTTGLKLTARGEYLAEIVPAAMLHVRDVISSRQVDDSVRLSINANLVPALLPYFFQSTARENQPLKVNIHKSPEEAVAQLRSRTAQYILGAVTDTRGDIESETILTEEIVTLVAFERPMLGGIRPTKEAFFELTHINLVENGAELFPQVAETLAIHGVRRSALFEVPDVMSAALMVSESKLALTVPRSIAGWLTKTLRLSVILPPIAIPKQEVAMCWLPATSNEGQRRMIKGIANKARQAIAKDHASVQVVRSIRQEGLSSC